MLMQDIYQQTTTIPKLEAHTSNSQELIITYLCIKCTKNIKKVKKVKTVTLN